MFSEIRLKKRRLEKGFSQIEIAEKLNINRSSYNSWESGRAKPNQKNLIALASILDVPETYFESEFEIVSNYLQLNQKNKLKANTFVNKLLTRQIVEERKVVNIKDYDVIKDVALAAGPGFGFTDEYETEKVYSDQEFFSYDIACWIEGDSMSPKYLNGEVALIKQTGFDYDGAVYALVWNGLTYIKKLYREEEGVRMVSINKDGNPDRFIPYDDDFHIVGKVVGHFMPLKGDFS